VSAAGARGRVLIVAGSDSGGGAGIQADIKSVTALGGFAMTAITAVTVQNTLGVADVHPVPLAIIRAQIEATASDLGVDIVKTGMLGDRATVETVAEALSRWAGQAPLVVDPVMVAKGGHALLDEPGAAAVRDVLVPRAFLVTPNAPEAERLTGLRAADVEGQKRAAAALVERGAKAALVKGGHIEGDVIRDVLAHQGGIDVFEGPRIATRATHGTGCTLASAIAARLAQGAMLVEAVAAARAYVLEAIRQAPGFGAGHGPLDHAWPLRGRLPI
jgi:hydroxymethylpyrimidine/phosphomethylpyrimidine kinase